MLSGYEPNVWLWPGAGGERLLGGYCDGLELPCM